MRLPGSLHHTGMLWALPNLAFPLLWLWLPSQLKLPLSAAWLLTVPLLASFTKARWLALGWLIASKLNLLLLAGCALAVADRRCLATPDCMSHSGIFWVLIIAAAALYPIICVLCFAAGRALALVAPFLWRQVARFAGSVRAFHFPHSGEP